MKTQTYNLWNTTPGVCTETPVIIHYEPDDKKYDAAVVIFPGGGYAHLAPHEGGDYAEFLAGNGITAFVVNYRVAPDHHFPLQLLDARRAVRFVRYNAEKFGIDKDKVAVMGSSAGGHLAALVSTYADPIEFEGIDEIDNEDFLPDRQILCYPVINLYDRDVAHIGSGNNLVGDVYEDSNDRISRLNLSPDRLVSVTTPDAFIWHTFEDPVVNINNSLGYIKSLKDYGIPSEFHMFPYGAHGLGLADKGGRKSEHVAQWANLLINWLKYTWKLG